MARFTHRYPLNAPGKYYVDVDCTDCDLCRELAPNNFRRDPAMGYSYVFKQPTVPEEPAACEEAVKGCPTEGVGNDGDQFDWIKTPIFDWNSGSRDGPKFVLNAPLLRPRKPWWKLC
ncbi:MAG: hypothetical protein RL514_1160 [Verrucomicrobiota bacterium]|jgi:ferredoxin